MRIGIDLLWVRPGICGGTESYVRNMLDGFAEYGDRHEYVLFATQDNAESFAKYENVKGMQLEVCPTQHSSQWKRILWENMHLDKLAKKKNIDVMYIPVYSKPLSLGKKLPYVTVFHDLQGLHYPEYFSYPRLQFFKWCWWYACKTSKKVIVLSDYGKADVLKYYPFATDKLVRIYNPIISNQAEMDFEVLAERYGIRSGEYFYCVSALLPHKNLKTILQVMQNWEGEEKLVLSGVGNQKGELGELIKEYELKDKLVLTGFVSDEERDCLYENCKIFLFPSVFEGFGMPPIEAMRKGKRVVMTDKTCLREVTQGKAIYVADPFAVGEWQEKINYAMTLEEQVEDFNEYSLEVAAGQYLTVFEQI